MRDSLKNFKKIKIWDAEVVDAVRQGYPLTFSEFVPKHAYDWLAWNSKKVAASIVYHRTRQPADSLWRFHGNTLNLGPFCHLPLATCDFLSLPRYLRLYFGAIV